MKNNFSINFWSVLLSGTILAFIFGAIGFTQKDYLSSTEDKILAQYVINKTIEGKFTKYEIFNKSATTNVTSKYYFSNFAANWDGAKDACVRLLSKKLVSVQTESKSDELKALIISSGRDGFATSGKFVTSTTSLTWLATNKKISFTDWAKSRSSTFTNDSCVILGNQTLRNWHVLSCNVKWSFICE